MKAQRVLLICHKAPFGRAMAAALHQRFGTGFIGILGIDYPMGRRQRIRRMTQSLFKTSFLERRTQRIERALASDAMKTFQDAAKPPSDWPSDVAVHMTDNPNKTDCVAWLAEQQPDIIAVTGAPILREPVFTLPRLGTLNMHSSLLPDYRGTQAEFWQVLEGRLQTCGVTVHYVNAGVDTGEIILQKATPAEPGLSPQALRTRNLLTALEVVPEAVAQVADGTAAPKQQSPGDGVTRRSRDKTLECRVRLLEQLGYRV